MVISRFTYQANYEMAEKPYPTHDDRGCCETYLRVHYQGLGRRAPVPWNDPYLVTRFKRKKWTRHCSYGRRPETALFLSERWKSVLDELCTQPSNTFKQYVVIVCVCVINGKWFSCSYTHMADMMCCREGGGPQKKWDSVLQGSRPAARRSRLRRRRHILISH